jgi:tRNA-Thr(GGU) m(6)t(6)A37 methyltransferase TsaA
MKIMAAYVIVQIDIHDPVAYERYRVMATPTVAAYGGRYVVRGGASEILEGSWQPRRLVILEFADAAKARAWWDSPEYAPAKALRQQIAHTEMLLIEGATPATYPVNPIGWVRSSLKETTDAPKQGFEGAPDATLDIEPAFVRGLDAIRVGQELIVLTWLHQADRDVLAVHPRDDVTNPLTGVFATRSADRPNPVGLHRVKVLEVDGGKLTVEGLEAIDGTPVIDLKPVIDGSLSGSRSARQY